ncbi:unnamed protein product [Candida verbasci]|uniref:Serine aminopeptidase S33 domain-containing protein n=1 Tax=Candida verbasci TaxID=1227364 RepID=A0A9W4XF32_9ASCO|nr:unnamed protein product [Candida verbasci]
MWLYSLAKRLIQIGVSIGAIALIGLYYFQNSLIYPASLNDGHGYCATPDEHSMEYKLIELKTKDGETLQCYSIKQDPKVENYKNKTILMLTPNAGNIGHALPIVSMFYKNFGYNVFIYSYRGYGKSTGFPSEKGLKIDADTVMDYIEKDEQYKAGKLILYGRSLGGAVAIYIAANRKVDAVVLENTFLSLKKTIPHVFPVLKYFTNFVHQKWNSEALISKITAPTLLISGTKDEIVPPVHMDIIYDKLKVEKKIIKYDKFHNDTILTDGYFEEIDNWIESLK